ncbi:MAG: T9SS type A sorting domain-containing protein [Ignavibacteria bacterium]|nr:T9SS type A sorting domain-containing protein [Ignavibacteria bacterium]
MKSIFLLLALSLALISEQAFSQSDLNKERKSKPAERERAFHEQRAFPYDKIPEGALVKALNEQRKFYTSKKSGAQLLSQQPQWRQAGPFDVGGRVRSIIHHPTNDGVVYVAAANGGVWKTINGGGKWEPIMDYENSISMGALAMDPKNPDILYAATGELASGHYGYSGAGVFKTTNGGTTWNLIGLANVSGFSKIYVHPMNSNLIYAGGVYSNAGFYKSTDAGATWRRTMNLGSICDISINPKDPNDVIAAVSGVGIYRSSDGGESWGDKKDITYDGVGRISVQMSPSDPKIVYALVDRAVPNSTETGAVIRSADNGQTWTEVFSDASIFNQPSQGSYDNFIAVHPTNPKIVLVGGVNLYRTDDNGANWTLVGGYGTNTHPDMHCAYFSPINPNTVYVGNDGGMAVSDDAGETWFTINNGLAVTQFHGNFALDQTKPKVMYGGSQDNGTMSNSAVKWGEISGGDGGFAAIDANNPNIVYAETQEAGSMFRVDVKNGTFANISSGFPAGDPGLWASPLLVDPGTNTLFSGRRSLYASYNQGAKWDKISPQLKSRISMIAASQVNPDIIYIGSERGELLVTNQGGGQEADAWITINTNGLPTRYVSDIEPSPNTENTCYITLSGFNSAHVFKTTDLGKTWKDIGKNLPDVPTNCLALHPDDENIMFVGTDIGVYGSYNGGESWFPLGTGFPNTSVMDLQFYTGTPTVPNTLILRASTHGRSMWEVDVPTEVITNQEITAPIGGESYLTGTTRHLSWYGFTPPVKVEYSINNGQSWSLITDNLTGDYLEWAVPTRNTHYARIRVSSLTNPTESRISRTFTIGQIQIGSVLNTVTVPFFPYGLAYDGQGSLWATSFYERKAYRINSTTYSVERIIPCDTLCTDLTLDTATGTLYVHKLTDITGSGGSIIVMDTNGVVIRTMLSSAKYYPVGLELVDGKLIAGDRDGKRILYTVDPATGETITSVSNPYQVAAGPRCLCYDGKQYVYQTGYGSSQYNVKIDKNDLSKEVSRMELSFNGSPINARAIEYDPRDKNFWVSDPFNGIIYKIAGFETAVGVDEPTDVSVGESLSASIYPNPANSTTFITYELNRPAHHLKVEITNLLGETVGTLFEEAVAGNNTHGILRFETSNLSNGIYSILFTLDGTERIVQKVVVAH